MPIYKAILKHGHSNFSLEILEYCPKDKTRSREEIYLSNLPLTKAYNVALTAGSLSGDSQTEEAKAKIKEAQRAA
jgi:group I intron endonuclease